MYWKYLRWNQTRKAADVINFVWKFNITYVFCLCIDWQLAAAVSLALKEAHDGLQLRIILRQFSRESVEVSKMTFVIYRLRKFVSSALKTETVRSRNIA